MRIFRMNHLSFMDRMNVYQMQSLWSSAENKGDRLQTAGCASDTAEREMSLFSIRVTIGPQGLCISHDHHMELCIIILLQPQPARRHNLLLPRLPKNLIYILSRRRQEEHLRRDGVMNAEQVPARPIRAHQASRRMQSECVWSLSVCNHISSACSWATWLEDGRNAARFSRHFSISLLSDFSLCNCIRDLLNEYCKTHNKE